MSSYELSTKERYLDLDGLDEFQIRSRIQQERPHIRLPAGAESFAPLLRRALANVIAFTDLPYMTDAGASCGQNFVNSGSAGTLDGVSIVSGHEYAEAMTDPQPSTGWVDVNGQENGDKCAWIAPGTPGGSADITLLTGTFAVQSLWSNAVDGCVISG